MWLAATDNFSVLYIASHSNSDLPTFYKISSIWSAHEGSMFLWIVFLALWGFLFNFYIGQSNPIKSLAVGVLSLIIVGFLLFLLLTSNPFQTILPVPPPNGADINPVLQDPALVIHPPTLYLGYVGFGIPILVALYSKNPLITTKGGCFEEAGGTHTKYVNTKNTDEIVSAIKEIEDNPDIRKEMIDNGYAHAKTFCDKSVNEKLNNIYSDLVNESRS